MRGCVSRRPIDGSPVLPVVYATFGCSVRRMGSTVRRGVADIVKDVSLWTRRPGHTLKS
jgi:hypothetical protein